MYHLFLCREDSLKTYLGEQFSEIVYFSDKHRKITIYNKDSLANGISKGVLTGKKL